MLGPDSARLDVDPAKVASIVVVHHPGRELVLEGQGTAGRRVNRISGRVTTALMRCQPAWLDAMPHGVKLRPGQPIYWCPREGYVEVWPPPGVAYDIQVRGKDGRMLSGDQTRQAQTVPVQSYINAITAAHQEQQRKMGEPARVERFTLLGEE